MIKNRFSIILTIIITFLININVYAKDSQNVAPPKIYGTSAITVDMQTGEIIYEKNIDSKIYPASTTKLLTAILLSENKEKDSTLTYTKGAKLQPPSSLNKDIHPINVGDTMSASSAMYGMLLHSANDIAYMIAENVSKDIQSFADEMNSKIKEFGLKNTHFVTPNGLHNPNHYSTAYDMSVIARQAFKVPWIRETISKSAINIKTSSGITFPLKNTNKLLGKDGCIGGKTGYTDAAGRCLVAIYERSGRKILGVVMHSIYDKDDTYVFNDMKKIIDWSYNEKPSTLFKKNSIITNKTIQYKPLGIGPSVKLNVPIYISQDITYYNNEVNKNELKENINIKSRANLKEIKGNLPIGTLKISQRDFSKSYALYSNISEIEILKKSLPIYITSFVLIIFLLYILARIIIKKFR